MNELTPVPRFDSIYFKGLENMTAKDTILPIEQRVKYGVWHGRQKLAEAQAEVSFNAGLQAIAEYIEAFDGLYCIANLDVAKFCSALKRGLIPLIGSEDA